MLSLTDFVGIIFGSEKEMRACLEQLRIHCQEHGVDKLTIPRLGTGADKIDWPFVRRILEDVFKDTDISITAYTSR